MKVRLLQLDGKIPNIALMRLAQHHRERGDSVELWRTPTVDSVTRSMFDVDEQPMVYASLIFEKTRPVAYAVQRTYPNAVIGGTGWNFTTTLEERGVGIEQDYSIYPKWKQSIGFTQRGCRLKCGFCVVPKKEGKVKAEQTINQLWRGDPWPKELILLDNDFFGQPEWRERIKEIRDGGFKVSFNQGINARMLNDEAAEAIASVDYRDDQMKTKRIYTAWDSMKDEGTLFRGLNALVRYGVKPDSIMVYMLIGYGGDVNDEDWLYRQSRLREFGARPYPMPFVRNSLTVGFQRWCIGAYDKRFTWSEWKAANCRPEKLSRTRIPLLMFN